MSVLKKKSMFFAAAISVLVIFALCFVFLVIFSFLSQKEMIAFETMNIFIKIGVFLSVFTSLTAISGARGKDYLIFCISSSCMFFFVLFIISAAIKKGDISMDWALSSFFLIIVAALCAAVIQIRQNIHGKRAGKRH